MEGGKTEFVCPVCGRKYAFSSSKSDRIGKCQCGYDFLLPAKKRKRNSSPIAGIFWFLVLVVVASLIAAVRYALD